MKDRRHPAEVWKNIVDHVFFFGERVWASPSHPCEYSNTDYTLPKIKSSKINIFLLMHTYIWMCLLVCVSVTIIKNK